MSEQPADLEVWSMSRDEHLAVLIRETLRDTIERQAEDPGAVDRVGVAVGAALGQAPDDEPARYRAAEPGDPAGDSILQTPSAPGRDADAEG